MVSECREWAVLPRRLVAGLMNCQSSHAWCQRPPFTLPPSFHEAAILLDACRDALAHATPSRGKRREKKRVIRCHFSRVPPPTPPQPSNKQLYYSLPWPCFSMLRETSLVSKQPGFSQRQSSCGLLLLSQNRADLRSLLYIPLFLIDICTKCIK